MASAAPTTAELQPMIEHVLEFMSELLLSAAFRQDYCNDTTTNGRFHQSASYYGALKDGKVYITMINQHQPPLSVHEVLSGKVTRKPTPDAEMVLSIDKFRSLYKYVTEDIQPRVMLKALLEHHTADYGLTAFTQRPGHLYLQCQNPSVSVAEKDKRRQLVIDSLVKAGHKAENFRCATLPGVIEITGHTKKMASEIHKQLKAVHSYKP